MHITGKYKRFKVSNYLGKSKVTGIIINMGWILVMIIDTIKLTG